MQTSGEKGKDRPQKTGEEMRREARYPIRLSRRALEEEIETLRSYLQAERARSASLASQVTTLTAERLTWEARLQASDRRFVTLSNYIAQLKDWLARASGPRRVTPVS